MDEQQMRRIASEAAEEAATKAIKTMFRTMGIVVSTDADVVAMQADFAWLRARRQNQTKAVAIVAGAIIAAFVAAGLTALWAGVVSIVSGGG